MQDSKLFTFLTAAGVLAAIMVMLFGDNLIGRFIRNSPSSNPILGDSAGDSTSSARKGQAADSALSVQTLAMTPVRCPPFTIRGQRTCAIDERGTDWITIDRDSKALPYYFCWLPSDIADASRHGDLIKEVHYLTRDGVDHLYSGYSEDLKAVAWRLSAIKKLTITYWLESEDEC